MRSREGRTLGLLLASLALFGEPGNSAFGDTKSKHTVAQVKEAWEARAGRLGCFVCEWEGKDVKARGSIARPGQRLFPGVPDNRYIPESDRISPISGRLVLDWPRYRFEYSLEIFSVPANAFVRRNVVSAFDGQSTKEIYDVSIDRREGLVTPALVGHDHAYISPIVLALCPLDTRLTSVQLDEATMHTVPSALAEVGETLLITLRSGRREESYYLDPNREYVITKRVTKIGHKIQSSLSIDYELRDNLWIPSHWSGYSNDAATGAPKRTYDCVATKFEKQLAVSDDLFAPEFVKGTIVEDLTLPGKGRVYVAGPAKARWLAAILLVAIAVAGSYLLARAWWKRSDAGSGI